jgi:hypothetical protein
MVCDSPLSPVTGAQSRGHPPRDGRCQNEARPNDYRNPEVRNRVQLRPLPRLKHLIDYLCESTSWVGSRLDAKDDFPIAIFRNEINALGDFRCGVKVARDFADFRSRSGTLSALKVREADQ